ncbi:PREDICTED: protein FAM50A-like [Priapulus caudatus]|uniref:Protein FAM50 homolog n=1 Tax=Priapulus caudatus TaxID=37621 RepID=A0ABM1DSI6_PRICU|nr:PREDICTED: protein FAM50A-like [Priapulus caudatus]
MAEYKGAASEAGRAMQLIKRREKEKKELELRKQKIEEGIVSNIGNKFAVHYDAVEVQLKSSTVGLVTLDQMKAKQEFMIKEREKQLAKKEAEHKLRLLEERQKEKQEQKQRATLSFNMDDDGSEEETEDVDSKEESRDSTDVEPLLKKKKLGKNPNVDTSFLPDKEREEEENGLREQLRQEWVTKQEKLRSEEIEITYSYWDGSGHRRNVRMKKGNSISQFLHRCLENLRKEFTELKLATVDQLMYIKVNTYYCDNPMLLRGWYEKNKHIFPASRWEPYDPEKNYDKYTISDKRKL